MPLQLAEAVVCKSDQSDGEPSPHLGSCLCAQEAEANEVFFEAQDIDPAETGSVQDVQTRGTEGIQQEAEKHVRRLQEGTPLQLRKLATDGETEKQVCIISVSKDLQTLSWQDQEGSGTVHDIPLSSIVNVAEDTEGMFVKTTHHVMFVFAKQAGAVDPFALELDFAYHDDVVSWREGLQLLIRAADEHAMEGALQQASWAAGGARV